MFVRPRTLTQPLFLVVYACFVGHAIEGYLIDLDHWRHFWLLMALIWGLMLGDRRLVSAAALDDPRAIFDAPEMFVSQRPARILRPTPRLIVTNQPARRVSGRHGNPPARFGGASGG